MKNAFDIVRDFEQAVAEYTGANYCIAVNSCTSAIQLCLEWYSHVDKELEIEIPKHTYVSVPMQIKRAGFFVKFRDENWSGIYQLKPLPVWDSARRFTQGMCLKLYDDNDWLSDYYMCVSFHWSKILGIQQGGAILTNSNKANKWFRKMRFDGRTEGVKPKDDRFDVLGTHCYLSPEIAAEGLVRLMHLPKNNPDLPMDDYPDLSQMEIFK